FLLATVSIAGIRVSIRGKAFLHERAMSDGPLNHPSAAELRALSLGQLTEADLARLSVHLRDCPECCRRIDQLATGDPLLARLQQTAARQEEMLVTPAQRRSAVRALRK